MNDNKPVEGTEKNDPRCDCGNIMDAGEAKVFTCCGECWNKHYPKVSIPESLEEGLNAIVKATENTALSPAPRQSDEEDIATRNRILSEHGIDTLNLNDKFNTQLFYAMQRYAEYYAESNPSLARQQGEAQTVEAKDERILALQECLGDLRNFKDYVHQRLDEAGIPTHPNGEHSKHGCRIGDRLDIVLTELQEKELSKRQDYISLNEVEKFAIWICLNGWVLSSESNKKTNYWIQIHIKEELTEISTSELFEIFLRDAKEKGDHQQLLGKPQPTIESLTQIIKDARNSGETDHEIATLIFDTIQNSL